MQLGPSEFISIGPCLGAHAGTIITNRIATFRVTDLLEPKACSRAIQYPHKSQVFSFRRMPAQLDDWRGLLEHLPTSIQGKIVVR
jgi:hypothetical protein